MGKTVKKQHQGRRVPREVQALPDSPLDLRRVDPEVVCPHCLASFNASALGGSHLERSCPRCEERISGGDYDAARSAVLEALAAAQEAAAPAHEKLDRLAKKEGASRWGLLKRWYRWRMAPVGRRYEDVLTRERQLAQKRRLVKGFARSRYYASPWFNLTGAALAREARGPLEAYELRPAYGQDESYSIRSCDRQGEGKGLLGEWRVFEALAQAASEGRLAEGGSVQLCPNLYLPNMAPRPNDVGGRRPGPPQALYRQVDCILLTERAVYIFEAKSWRRDIHISSGKRAGKRTGKHKGQSIEHSPQQCAGHADAFAELYPAIPFDRVYELVVYVDPASFANDRHAFYRNACSSVLGDGDRCGPRNFIDVIAEEEDRLAHEAPLFEPGELERVGDEIRARFGDVNGRKEYLHRERLQSIEAWHEARRAS